MKKLLNKSVGVLLAVFLLMSVLIIGLAKIDFSLLKVKAEYSRDYSELTDKDLDELSYRSTPGNNKPQITVFTHGLGCAPSYWSNQVGKDSKGKEKWVFAYQSHSMIETLRRKIGEDKATVMTASVGFGEQAVEWANLQKTTEEATSKQVSDENEYVGNENPAASFRAQYYDFKEIVRTMQDESFLKRVAKQAVEVHNKEIKESRELKIKTKQLSEVERKLNNITEAICNGIFNSMTQAKMVELTELKDKLAVEIQEEETKTIQPIQEEKVLKFLKNYSRLVKCVEKEDSLKNKKALFDMFIKEVIFDGERCLIVMKTAEEDVNTEKKEKSRTIHDFFRERFETLPFGDPNGT